MHLESFQRNKFQTIQKNLIVTNDILWRTNNNSRYQTNNNSSSSKQETLNITFKIMSLLGISLESIFLYGILSHNICLSKCYIVFALVITGILIYFAFIAAQPTTCLNALWSAMIAGLCIKYVEELDQIQRHQQGECKRQCEITKTSESFVDGCPKKHISNYNNYV